MLEVAGGEGARANAWHTDVTFVVAPPKATTLRSLVIPPYGGDTLFSNTAAAYSDLPEHLRAARRPAVGGAHQRLRLRRAPAVPHRPRSSEYHKVFVSHPVPHRAPGGPRHPDSGEPNLFIGGFATSIIGLSSTESRDILRLLQALRDPAGEHPA